MSKVTHESLVRTVLYSRDAKWWQKLKPRHCITISHPDKRLALHACFRFYRLKALRVAPCDGDIVMRDQVQQVPINIIVLAGVLASDTWLQVMAVLHRYDQGETAELRQQLLDRYRRKDAPS